MSTEGVRLADLAVAMRRSTLDRLRRVPSGREGWRPVETALSFADLAHHLREADDWLLDKFRDPGRESMRAEVGEGRISESTDYVDLLEALEESGRRRADWLQRLSADELASSVQDDRFGEDVSLWWVIVRGNLDHESHHRGQIATYLRLLRTMPSGAKTV